MWVINNATRREAAKNGGRDGSNAAKDVVCHGLHHGPIAVHNVHALNKRAPRNNRHGNEEESGI